MIETAEQKIVDAAIVSRRSIRAFLPQTVARDDIEKILEVAARAPSGTNTQPWKVYVLTGAIKDRLSREIVQAYTDTAAVQDYPRQWVSPYIDRRRKMGWDLYGLLGLTRDNKA